MIKTASEFVAALKDCATYKTLYVYGCFGAPMTPANQDRYIKAQEYNQKPDRVARIRAAGSGTFGFDCVCLIKGLLWGWCGDPNDIYGGADYLTDIVPDLDAEQMVDACDDISRDFTDILPGEVVGMSGHIGVYVGDGLVIESTPRWEDGVQYTALGNVGQVTGYPSRIWDRHGKLPYIEYDTEDKPAPTPAPEVPEHARRYHTIEEVPSWGRKTIERLYNCGWLMGRGEDLDLSDDMVRILVILDRAKVFDGKEGN